jgi:hypothetical protein
MQQLLAKRHAQLLRLRRLQGVCNDEFIGHCLSWLEYHPLRVLNPLSIEVLDEIEGVARKLAYGPSAGETS